METWRFGHLAHCFHSQTRTPWGTCLECQAQAPSPHLAHNSKNVHDCISVCSESCWHGHEKTSKYSRKRFLEVSRKLFFV